MNCRKIFISLDVVARRAVAGGVDRRKLPLRQVSPPAAAYFRAAIAESAAPAGNVLKAGAAEPREASYKAVETDALSPAAALSAPSKGVDIRRRQAHRQSETEPRAPKRINRGNDMGHYFRTPASSERRRRLRARPRHAITRNRPELAAAPDENNFAFGQALASPRSDGQRTGPASIARRRMTPSPPIAQAPARQPKK